ncbi:putative Polycomb group protein ASXL2 isoform X3 [Lytechinus variegatus]|uniref:putative Polycomb group protein ASXL2 isoform X3 n=1 Tax=Lytechinus variegatus TaxID=7654 RepID=UPI001BB1816E|nr:putative Polycomb group protein ASXL2 isoform X3 [Lytechinus variegatus]
MKDRKRRSKGRTWVEAARMVLEKHPKTPMSYKEILRDIQEYALKDINGTQPLACLNAMLHSGSRGKNSAFYKVGGLMGVYGLKTDLPKEATAMLELQSEDGTDVFPVESSDDDNDDETDRPYVPIKKRPVCVLPERGHFAIPSIERFKRDSGLEAASGSGTTNGQAVSRLDTDELDDDDANQQIFRVQSPTSSSSSSHRHRRKQTIIPRIILKPLKPPDKADGTYFLPDPSQSINTDEVDSAKPSPDVDHRNHMLPRSQTISEILASLPGFSGKPRRRHKKNKKYGSSPFPDFRRKSQVDLETPNSVLANVNLKNLINKHTFTSLPAHHQHKLLKMLPNNDRHKGPDNCLRLGGTALDNEFFARACTKWRERLASGEFTPESQAKLKAELDKERAKLDPWKTKHFEPVWGQSSVPELQSKYSSSSKATKTPPKIHKASSSSTSVSSSSSTSVSSSTKASPTKPQKHVVNHRVQEPPAKIILKISVPKDGVAGGVSILKKSSKTISKERSSSSSSSSEISSSSSSSQKAKSSILTSIGTASPAQYSCSTLLSTMAAASQRHQAAAGGTKVGEVKRSAQLIPPDLSVKRPSDSEESPEKRQRVDSDASSSGVSKTRTLAQIKSQAQLKPVQSQTRTLAQIKAQMAARAHQGQTRTLAQIKAQTSAKVHARLVPGNAQGAARPSVHSPAILGRPRATSHNWMNLKSIVPSNATSVTGGGARMHLEGLHGDSKSGSPNKVLTVTVSNSTPGQPVIQTVKPIIIKTQPGLSVVLVSQSSMSILPSNASRVVQGNSQKSSLKTTNSVATLVSSKVSNNSKTVAYITLPSSKAVASVTPPSTVTSGSSNASQGNQSSAPSAGKVTQISSASSENRTVNLVHGKVSIANGAIHTSTVQLPGKDAGSTHSQPTVAKVVPLSNNNSSIQNTVCSCQSSVVMSSPITSKSGLLPSGGKDSPEGTATTLAGKCTCRLKAMVMCKGCGAFCHNDCIGPSNLCVSCLIR